MMHAAKLFRGNALRKGFSYGVFSQVTKLEIKKLIDTKNIAKSNCIGDRVFSRVNLLKVALSQKILVVFYFSKKNIPNHYP